MSVKHSFLFSCTVLGLAAFVAVSTFGCGGASGPARYKLSGTVTYDGKPVPAGEVAFEPDSSKGNSGPGSLTLIKDGKYQTEPDKGVVGGPYIVRIAGFDGVPVGDSTEGTGLFPRYETKVDLPKQDGTQDFTVPAAKK